MAQQVDAALAELLASLEEQNISLEVSKVPNKALLFEIRLPDRSGLQKHQQMVMGNQHLQGQETFANQLLFPAQAQGQALGSTAERRQLQQQMLG